MMNTAAEQAALQAAQIARQQRRHQGRDVRYEGTRMECPHCGAQSVIRHGRVVSKTMRETFYACTDVECGYTFCAMTEIVRGMSPSAKPDPTVNIPLSSHVRRDMVRVMLDHAGEAHHDPITPIAPTTGDLFAGGGRDTADTS